MINADTENHWRGKQQNNTKMATPMKVLCALALSRAATSASGNFTQQRTPAMRDGATQSDSYDTAGKTFVHLFEWSWSDVALECEQFLGPNGYDAVQVSPPMEHITGDQWWTRYQPVSYDLVSRSGNADQFKDMVQRCQQAGVKIYADSVINHMASGSGTGINGHSFGGRTFNGLYSQDDFHHSDNDKSTNCGVSDYSNQHNVQYCDLVSLPDLCTGCEYVQQTLSGYLKKLAGTGVAGFRVDAAKHQASKLSRVSTVFQFLSAMSPVSRFCAMLCLSLFVVDICFLFVAANAETILQYF